MKINQKIILLSSKSSMEYCKKEWNKTRRKWNFASEASYIYEQSELHLLLEASQLVVESDSTVFNNNL